MTDIEQVQINKFSGAIDKYEVSKSEGNNEALQTSKDNTDFHHTLCRTSGLAVNQAGKDNNVFQ